MAKDHAYYEEQSKAWKLAHYRQSSRQPAKIAKGEGVSVVCPSFHARGTDRLVPPPPFSYDSIVDSSMVGFYTTNITIETFRGHHQSSANFGKPNLT